MRAIRQRWPRQLDHYYWLTASLAAHDMQKSACRVVAAIVLCLGAIPLHRVTPEPQTCNTEATSENCPTQTITVAHQLHLSPFAT